MEDVQVGSSEEGGVYDERLGVTSKSRARERFGWGWDGTEKSNKRSRI